MHPVQQLSDRSLRRASAVTALPVVDNAAVADTVVSSTGSTTVASYTHTVQHGGNHYFATQSMAEIFHSNAQLVVARGDTELVPLLHSRGVDLLVISPKTAFAVVLIEVGQLKAS